MLLLPEGNNTMSASLYLLLSLALALYSRRASSSSVLLSDEAVVSALSLRSLAVRFSPSGEVDSATTAVCSGVVSELVAAVLAPGDTSSFLSPGASLGKAGGLVAALMRV